MYKAKIETIYSEGGYGAYAVLQDGIKIAEINGGKGEYYVYVGDRKDPNNRPIARFKHHKALSNAKDFMKFIAARATGPEIIAGCNQDSPLGWAEKKWNYECLNTRTVKKHMAERAAREAAYKNIVLVG